MRSDGPFTVIYSQEFKKLKPYLLRIWSIHCSIFHYSRIILYREVCKCVCVCV